MKRKISFLLALLLLMGLLSMLPVGAVSAAEIYKYTENPDGTLTLTEYSGKTALVSVPATLDGKPVSAVADGLFKGHDEILRVYICEGVKSIGREAFSGCSSLLYLELPDSLTSIGDSAFSGCAALEFAVIPDAVTSVGASAFSGCKALSAVVFLGVPEGAVYGSSAFGGAKLYAPAGSAVAGYASAASLEFGATSSTDFKYKRIGLTCTITSYNGNASAIVIPETVDGLTVAALAENSFSAEAGHAKEAEIIVIPDTVSVIPTALCRGNTALRYVKMPETLGGGVGRDSFYGCTSLRSIRIPRGATNIFDAAFRDCSALKTVIFDNSVPSISYEAFRDCSALETFLCPGNAPATPAGSLATMVAFSGVGNATVYTDSASVWDLKGGKWEPDFTAALAVSRIDASCIHTETVLTPASCAVDGLSEMTCRFCGDSWQFAHPVIEHIYISTGVSGGYESFYCKNCISNYTRRHVSACTVIPTLDTTLPEGSRITELTLTFKGDAMVQDVDYKFTESYNSFAGRTVLNIVGIGDYVGELHLTYIEKSHSWVNYYTVTAPGTSGGGHYAVGDIVIVTPVDLPEGVEPYRWSVVGAEILSAGVGGATFVMPDNDVTVTFELKAIDVTVEPPETEPPVTEPPVTEPPQTEPPQTEAPVTDEPDDTDPPIVPPIPPDKQAYIVRWAILGGILLLSLGGIITLCVIMFRKE